MFGFNTVPGLASNHQTIPGIVVLGRIQAGGTITTPFVNVEAISSDNSGIDCSALTGTGGAIVGQHSGDGGQGVQGVTLGNNSTAIFAYAEGTGSTALHGQVTEADGVGLHVEGLIRVNQAAAHSLGAYSGKAIKIYDSSGILLGWIPVYT